jgi:ribosome-binding protein aMBF1 (putative translation factor)
MRAKSLLVNFYYPNRVVRPGRRRRADSQYRPQAARLALRLREIREQAGLSQESLAAQAQVAVGTVRKIEQGAVIEPGYFTVIGLLNALGVTPEDLQL